MVDWATDGCMRLLDAVPDAVALVRPDGVIFRVNVAAGRMFGYQRDELVGLPLTRLLPAIAHRFPPDARTPTARTPTGRTPTGQAPTAQPPTSQAPAPTTQPPTATQPSTNQPPTNFQSPTNQPSTNTQPASNQPPTNTKTPTDGPARQTPTDGPPRAPAGDRIPMVGLRRDGCRLPVEVSLREVSGPHGGLLAIVARDVDGRVEASDAHARLATIVQSSQDAIISKTLDGTITTWNPAATKIYGWSAEEAIGQSIYLLVPPDSHEEERRAMASIAAGTPVERRRTVRVRKDGSTVMVSMALSPIVDASGTVVGIASISRDLTEQERAEAKVRGLLAAAPDAIVGVDTTGTIVLANAQAERLFGYQPEELIGRSIESLVPESIRSVHRHHRDRYFADPVPRPMGAGLQLSARRRDGTEFPAEISLSALQTEEGLLVSAAVRDVTDRIEAQAERERLKAQAERQRLESQLHRSRRLESLGQLAGGVAHDFNNLLGVILNYAEFVAEEVETAAHGTGRPDWVRVGADVGQIQKAAERAITLTHQLLAFGRREVIRPRVMDLNEVIRELEDLLRRSIGEHVKLTTNLKRELPPIKADPGQLEQVLVNLAVNARHAMSGGGKLNIDTDVIDVDQEFASARPDVRPGRYVRLRVSDTGTGMPKDVIDRAFEPFFTTKPKGEGSGLGLATVYGIVAQAGGHVWIYSELGLGTSVNVLIPTTGEELTPTEEPVRRARRTGGETVLLVEDEEAMRQVTERILRRNGYEVLVAGSGSEAIALAQGYEGDIDMLLTDVIMPKLLGKEVAERVVLCRPGIRVLYMSGYALPVLTDQGTLDPSVSLLEKPFTEVELLDAVRDVLDGTPPAAG